jgi:ABC-2 type transport system ATP-binding protein
MESLVSVDQMTKQYGEFKALDDCTLLIPQGSIFGLLGPNGAGKTTLIRCLMGYLRPTSGRATIDGLDCVHQSLEIRRRVSYLPAESKLFRLMRGNDCIEFVASIHPRDNRQLAIKIAERLELDLSRRVAFMSTGMRQKLAICCVMSCRSRLMILDEPTANLDPTVRSEVLQLVRESCNEGVTIAFCSHVLSEIEEICYSAAIMRRGRVVHTIELSQLRYVHRIQAISTNASMLRDMPSNRRLVSEYAGKITLELDGPLDIHLDWLKESGLQSIAVEAIGLRSIYEQYHPTYQAPDNESIDVQSAIAIT